MTIAADPLSLAGIAFLASILWMTLWWLAYSRVGNLSLADVGWCFGLALVLLWYAVSAYGDWERHALVAAMGILYSLRLGVFLLRDRVLGRKEDARYRRLKASWADRAGIYAFLYFQLQAAAIALFSLPFLAVMQNPRPAFSLWELAGVLLWLLAVAGETIADFQLAGFRSKPWNRDRVCREGLWRYSRHPNYFFEWLHWWAYVVMAVGTPSWFVTWIGPAVMGWALLKGTGIPWSEDQALATRGEDYRAYQRATNAFFPWFPKSP